MRRTKLGDEVGGVVAAVVRQDGGDLKGISRPPSRPTPRQATVSCHPRRRVNYSCSPQLSDFRSLGADAPSPNPTRTHLPQRPGEALNRQRSLATDGPRSLIDRAAHEHLGATPSESNPRLLDGLGEHREGVV
jgi:hypothetical protein